MSDHLLPRLLDRAAMRGDIPRHVEAHEDSPDWQPEHERRNQEVANAIRQLIHHLIPSHGSIHTRWAPLRASARGA